MDGMRGGRRKGTIGMGVRGKKVRYKMDGMRGRRKGTIGMGVREKKGRYERDVSEGERKVQEGWE